MLQSLRKLLTLHFLKNTDTTSTPSAVMEEVQKLVRKPRYDGRTKKRKWEERRTDKGAAFDPPNTVKQLKSEVEVTGELIEKVKRRKFAILMGYSGTNYYGMQRNPNMATIEEEFFKSLFKNSYISDENYAQVQTMQFQRAARTDKGVSAARQVISIKLPENIEVGKLNAHLPEDIRVFGLRRVTKGFNSKTLCDSRSYFYLLPTVAFTPKDEQMVQANYRLPKDTLERINSTLQKYYIGTKNFHNFTLKKKFNDPSAKRFMKKAFVDTPFVKDDVEFAIFKIQGQSFMLHQIRKMIGLLIAVIKGYTGEETLQEALGENSMTIPKAPGLGLVLDFVHYDRYDYKYGSDGVHEKLTWEEVDKDVLEFRDKYIYPTILNTEIKEESMVNWIIRKLSRHGYHDNEEELDDDETPAPVVLENRQ